MASSRPSTDITETVCQYPDCSDQLKDPKLLPCLHRYCRNCLTSVIQSARKRMFKCSVCKQDCKIPNNGVDGFKTDLHMTSRLLLNKLQDSFVSIPKLICYSCSKELKRPACCIKCEKILCEGCFVLHRTDEFQDHFPHTLNMKTITVKLSPFTLDPICANRMCMTNRAQSLCFTCRNVPICIICVDSLHKDHKVHDVVKFAERERKLLEAISLDFAKQERELCKILQLVYLKKLKIQCKLTENDFQHKSMLRDVKANIEKAKNELKIKYEDDMEKLEQKLEQESKEAREQHDRIKTDYQKQLEDIEKKIQELPATGHVQLVNESQGNFKISEQLIKRNKNVKATYSSILDSKDFWSDAQCIPYIRKAIESLNEDMDQKISELGRTFELPGTFKCGDVSTCTVCKKHIVTSTYFTSNTNKINYNTQGHIRCNTKYVIYLISCDVCGTQYVGETSRLLSKRFDEHVTDVKDNKITTALVKHFNSNNHSVKDMKLQGIQCLSSDENLFKEEKKWMIKLGTRVDDGLNIK